MRLRDAAAGVLMNRYGMDHATALVAAKEVMEALDRDLSNEQLEVLGVGVAVQHGPHDPGAPSSKERGYRNLMRLAAVGLV